MIVASFSWNFSAYYSSNPIVCVLSTLFSLEIFYFDVYIFLHKLVGRSSELKRLWIADCFCISDMGLIKAVSKLPLLEQLEIFLCCFDAKTLGTVGMCCPLLKSLKLNQQFCTGKGMVCDREAIAIAKTMPKLRHLQILGNALSDKGLQAILDGCTDLESLDLRQCFNLKFEGQLGKVCVEKIKTLHMPHDSTDDYEFNTDIIYCDGDDFEDYPNDLLHDNKDSDSYGYDNVDDDDDNEHDPGEEREEHEVVCTICHPLVWA